MSHGEDIAPGLAWRLIGLLLLGAVAACALTFLLPDNRYIRHQQAGDTVMLHARWIYERIHFDHTPIDIAIVGSSRLEAGASPQILSDRLTRLSGRPVHVANLSLVRPGRDYSWLVVRQLLDVHPEVRMILLSCDGDAMFTHPMFKATADAADIVRAPLLLNIKYFENLLYLPYRNIDYGAQTLAPRLFGVQATFDRSQYPGTGLDRTRGYVAPTGERVNGDQRVPEPVLRRSAEETVAADATGAMRYLRRLPPDMGLAGDRAYVRGIAALARARGVQLVFVKMPIYGGMSIPTDDAFDAHYGRVVAVEGVSRHPEYYWNGTHLNRSGAIAASQQLASGLAPAFRPSRLGRE